MVKKTGLKGKRKGQEQEQEREERERRKREEGVGSEKGRKRLIKEVAVFDYLSRIQTSNTVTKQLYIYRIVARKHNGGSLSL